MDKEAERVAALERSYEVLAHYVQHTKAERLTDPDEAVGRIDAVARELVGCVDIGALYGAADEWARFRLALICEGKKARALVPMNEADRAALMKQRGIPERRHLDLAMSKVLWHLIKTSGLFIDVPEQTSDGAAPVSAPATIFLVPKKIPCRTVASILGSVLWDMRVRGLNLGDRPELRSLYAQCTRAADLEGGWSTDIQLDETQLELLQKAHRECSQHLRRELWPRWVPGPTRILATDASSDEMRLAAVGFEATSSKDQAWVRSWPHNHTDIGLAELEAVVLGVEFIMKQNPDTTLLIIITDSQSARGRIERGYAENPLANKMLIDLKTNLRGARIDCDYMPTDDNVADCPTRSVELITSGSGLLDRRWIATLERGRHMQAIATGEAIVQGRQTMRRQRSEGDVAAATRSVGQAEDFA